MNAAELAGYTEEFQEFSASHGVPCGSGEDLRGLVVCLEMDGIFAEECSCMLRSVMYRERGEADPGALLMLVTRVWGGMAEADEETLRVLRQFVRGAVRRPEIKEAECGDPSVSAEAACRELIVDAQAEAVAELITAAAERALPAMELESAIRELEARSPEVRIYRDLVNQRDAALAAERVSSDPVGGTGEAVRQCAFARGFDPWDESSELQTELRRFARHRERMAAREAEKAARPLHAKLLGGAESVLGQLLGGSKSPRRDPGLRSH